MTHYTVRG